MKILLSDSEFSEEFSAEESSHGRRSVAGHGPAQLLSSQLLKCPAVLSEIFMFNLGNGGLMELSLYSPVKCRQVNIVLAQ